MKIPVVGVSTQLRSEEVDVWYRASDALRATTPGRVADAGIAGGRYVSPRGDPAAARRVRAKADRRPRVPRQWAATPRALSPG